MEADKLKAKHEACTRHHLTSEQMNAFRELIKSLEHGSIRELMRHIATVRKP